MSWLDPPGRGCNGILLSSSASSLRVVTNQSLQTSHRVFDGSGLELGVEASPQVIALLGSRKLSAALENTKTRLSSLAAPCAQRPRDPGTVEGHHHPRSWRTRPANCPCEALLSCPSVVSSDECKVWQWMAMGTQVSFTPKQPIECRSCTAQLRTSGWACLERQGCADPGTTSVKSRTRGRTRMHHQDLVRYMAPSKQSDRVHVAHVSATRCPHDATRCSSSCAHGHFMAKREINKCGLIMSMCAFGVLWEIRSRFHWRSVWG